MPVSSLWQPFLLLVQSCLGWTEKGGYLLIEFFGRKAWLQHGMGPIQMRSFFLCQIVNQDTASDLGIVKGQLPQQQPGIVVWETGAQQHQRWSLLCYHPKSNCSICSLSDNCHTGSGTKQNTQAVAKTPAGGYNKNTNGFFHASLTIAENPPLPKDVFLVFRFTKMTIFNRLVW